MNERDHALQQKDWRGEYGPLRDDPQNGTGVTRRTLARTVRSIVDRTLTLALDALGLAVHGTFLYRGVGAWVPLAPGADGRVLTTHSVGVNPTWEPPAAGGNPTIRANGVDIGTRPNINFLGASVLGADDAGADEVEVTIYAYVEPRTSDPDAPVDGQIWLRTDL
jgi:hypothetical protein